MDPSANIPPFGTPIWNFRRPFAPLMDVTHAKAPALPIPLLLTPTPIPLAPTSTPIALLLNPTYPSSTHIYTYPSTTHPHTYPSTTHLYTVTYPSNTQL